MYKLTLTASERSAIDWIGDRYSTGTDFYDLLCDCEWSDDWDSPGEISISIPEWIAWEIDQLFREEEYSFPCFSGDFTRKLLSFSDSIV